MAKYKKKNKSSKPVHDPVGMPMINMPDNMHMMNCGGKVKYRLAGYLGHETEGYGEDVDTESTKGSGISQNQAIATGTAALSGAGQVAQTYNTPGSTIDQKFSSISGATGGVAGSINPLYGMAGTLGNTIGSAYKTNANKIDKNGNLVSRDKAEAGYAIGMQADPLSGIATSLSTGVFTPRQYADRLEKEYRDANPIASPISAPRVQDPQDAAWQRLNSQTMARFGGRMFESGGNMNSNLIEYNGGFTHDDNSEMNINEGIPLGNKNIVEKGETRNKDYIFSDTLKKGKLTYAQLSKRIGGKFRREGDEMESSQKELMLDQLKNSQEELREKIMSRASKKAFGKNGMEDENMMNNQEMIYSKMGGGLSRSEDYGSKNKPYPSVQSEDFAGGGRSYPIPTKQDAIDALRLAGLHGRSDVRSEVFAKYPELKKDKMVDGGGLSTIRYIMGADGQLHDVGEQQSGLNLLKPNKYADNQGDYIHKQQYQFDPLSMFNNKVIQTPITQPGYVKPEIKQVPSKSPINQPVNGNYLGSNTNSGVYSTPETGLGRPSKSFDQNSLYNAGNFLGAGYDIYRGLKGGDPVNFDRVSANEVTPDLVNYQPSRDIQGRDIKESFRGAQKESKNINNPAEYRSIMTQLAGQRGKGLSDAYAKSYQDEANVNAELKGKSKYFNAQERSRVNATNAQIQMQEAIAKQQEKDIASNTLSTGLYNLGSAAVQMGVDKKSYATQDQAKKLIGTGDYSYSYDNKGKLVGIKYNQTGKVIPIQ